MTPPNLPSWKPLSAPARLADDLGAVLVVAYVSAVLRLVGSVGVVNELVGSKWV